MSYCYNLGLLFYKVATDARAKIAFRYPDGTEYTYGQVNSLSNQLARMLLNAGVKKGDVIAIFNEKSVYAYSLMLGCLKIGAVYTNLDVSSPLTRIEKILNNCGPRVVFFDQPVPLIEKNALEQIGQMQFFNLADVDQQTKLRSFTDDNLKETALVSGGDPSYIMFTSGSTGFPKGAVMSHNNVLNFIQWGRHTFEVNAEDIFTNANPIYFDNSVFDFYISLYNAATLVPLGHDLVKNAQQLVKAINNSGCTIWFSVPSLLVYLLTTKALTENDFKTMRRISFGGEGFPKNKLKQLYAMFGTRVMLYNVYGPTECTCICSSYIISEKDFENMNELAPLGNIAENFGYEILPSDVTNPDFGELCLTGPCVGLGYFNDPERTSVSFVQNPGKKFNQLMYKTGDIVEKSANGFLHFKGRVDNQVKVMGYRIELEEIEAAFSTLNYVNEAGVIYEKISAELGQIKAFVSISDVTVDKNTVLSDLKQLLPPYMIPRTIIFMDMLPKNANGKIDRKQLATL